MKATEKELIAAAKKFYGSNKVKYKKFILTLYKSGDLDEEAVVEALDMDAETPKKPTATKPVQKSLGGWAASDGCGHTPTRSFRSC